MFHFCLSYFSVAVMTGHDEGFIQTLWFHRGRIYHHHAREHSHRQAGRQEWCCAPLRAHILIHELEAGSSGDRRLWKLRGSSSDTSGPQLLIFPKQFHQLRTKYLSPWGSLSLRPAYNCFVSIFLMRQNQKEMFASSPVHIAFNQMSLVRIQSLDQIGARASFLCPCT